MAAYGEYFLGLYVFDPISGSWEHVDNHEENFSLSLNLILTKKLYAKDEQSRNDLMTKQLTKAHTLVENMDIFSLDNLSRISPRIGAHLVVAPNARWKKR